MGTQSVLTHISWNRIFAKAISSTQDYPRCRTTWTQTTRRESCPERPRITGAKLTPAASPPGPSPPRTRTPLEPATSLRAVARRTDMWIKRGHHVVHNSYVSFRDFLFFYM